MVERAVEQASQETDAAQAKAYREQAQPLAHGDPLPPGPKWPRLPHAVAKLDAVAGYFPRHAIYTDKETVRAILQQTDLDEVVSLAPVPADLRVSVEWPKDLVQGAGTDAPLARVVFTGFDCAYCAKLVPTLDRLVNHLHRPAGAGIGA